MPFSLTFPSADAPATASSLPGVASPSNQPPGAAGADTAAAPSAGSFDSCLTRADQPGILGAEGKSARGDTASPKVDEESDNDTGKKSAKDNSSALTADQLAALLGMVGAIPPPPVPLPAPNLVAPSSADFSSPKPADASGPADFVRQSSTQTQGRFFAKILQGSFDSGAAQIPSAPPSGKGAPDVVTTLSLQNGLTPQPLAEVPAASGNTPSTSPTVGKSISPKTSVRQLLASGVSLLEYSFGQDGKPLLSVPTSLTAPAAVPPADRLQSAAEFAPLASLTQPQAVFSFAPEASSAPQPQQAAIPLLSSTLSPNAADAPPTSVASPSRPVSSQSDQPASGADVSVSIATSNPAASDVAPVVSNAVSVLEQNAVLKTSNSDINLQNGQGGAKIAVRDTQPFAAAGSGVKSSNLKTKNQFQNAEDQGLASTTSTVGTRGAKRVFSMLNDNPSSFANARSSDPFAALAAASLNSDNAPRTAEAVAPTFSDVASHAAQTVREIRDIADGLWAVEKNSVEVRFNFSESEKLSVRVEYRDGTVQATFRTDSPALRDHLASEWQAQASPADARPYRIAEPVFGSGQGQSSSNQAQGFSFGGDFSRQQRSSDHAASTPSTSTFSFSRSAPSTTTVTPVAPRLLRPETTLHLNAFA